MKYSEDGSRGTEIWQEFSKEVSYAASLDSALKRRILDPAYRTKIVRYGKETLPLSYGGRLWDRANADLSELWDHTQRELIVALLARYSPTVRTRILTHMQESFAGLVTAYLRWRMELSDFDVKDFLARSSRFVLAPRGGSRKNQKSGRLPQAVSDFDRLSACFKRKLRKRYRNPAARKLDIQRAFTEALGTTDCVPQKKWERWKHLAGWQIALEAAALKNDIGAVYLKRRMPHTRAQIRAAQAVVLLKEQEDLLPAAREISQKQEHLKARVRRDAS